MNNKKIIGIIALIIVFILSFLIFFGFGAQEKNGIDICSFVFILITELVFYACILFLNNKTINNAFTIAGLSSLTFIYCFISVLFNIFLINVFNTLKSILIFNFVILLMYVFIVLIIMLFKRENV